MDATYLYICLITGLLISILCEEALGLSAGGLVVPGYLAMICTDAVSMLLVYIVSFTTYLTVNYGLPKLVILYGKRRLAAAVFVGVIYMLLLELIFPGAVPAGSDVMWFLGLIAPALITHQITRQGFRYTVPASLAAAYATFAVVKVIFMII